MSRQQDPSAWLRGLLIPLLLIPSLFGGTAALAGPVFGPQIFHPAAGLPRTETQRFEVSRPGAGYRLVVDNGGIPGGRQGPPVIGGTIYLNGRRIVQPFDLWAHDGHLSLPVELAAANTLGVRLLGQRSALLTVTVEPITETAVYGPEAFTRNHRWFQIERRTFGIADPSVDYRLMVYNGGREGIATGRPVFGGAIRLNGKQVVGTLDLWRHRDHAFGVPVRLDGENRLEVELRGLPGEVLVLAIEPVGNIAPVADAGADQSVPVGTHVQLDGSASSDLNGDPLSFRWTLAARPDASAATLQEADNLRSTFLADVPGEYRIELTVNDGTLESLPDTVIVSTRNSAPVANAGADQSVFIDDLVTLDGSASHDIDGDPLSFAWQLRDRPDGSHAALERPTDMQPTFRVDRAGDYLAELVVNDGSLASTPDQVLISTENSAPVADAGPDRQTTVCTEVALDGSSSFDADGDTLTWQWALTVAPTGSNAVLRDADQPVARLTPDRAGTYVGQLVVNDSHTGSEPDTAVIEADEPAPDRPPQIDSTPPTTATIGVPYRYAVAASDPDGDALRFSLEAAPTGMTIDAADGLIVWTPQRNDQGAHSVRIRVSAGAALVEQNYTLVVGLPADGAPRITSWPISTAQRGEHYRYRVVAEDPEAATLTYALAQGPSEMTIDAASGLLDWPAAAPGTHHIVVTATDPAGQRAEQRFTLTIEKTAIPADPAAEAPPLADVPNAPFIDDVRFLFEGPNAVQSGLQPAALTAQRVAVLRGQVLDPAGEPLVGVRVSVNGQPQLGRTLSRADGWFDLVVNGGGELTVHYAKSGYLPVQRILEVPRGDYAVLPEVVLTALAADSTLVRLGADVAEPQLAPGAVVDDGDGPRHAAVLIPPGTTATYTRADGSETTLERMTLRATEYTVGENGPRAMPGVLPPATGYTYAVELSADEALADGIKVAGKDVRFNQPVSVYVDNFIGFPVGGVVPVGYYDSDANRWVAAENGRVIKILNVNQELAVLDLDGSGTAAPAAALAALGISNAERAQLAAAYAPGSELWRFQTRHLSTWDCNWPYGPPDDAKPPPPLRCDGGGGPSVSGSAIRIGAGTMSERFAIPGTDQALVFNSARVASQTGIQPLTGAKVHPKLKRVEYRVSIAGQVIQGRATPVANQSLPFSWNGRDAYGRAVRGAVTAHAVVSNVYTPVRYPPARWRQVFGSFLSMMSNPGSRGANAISLKMDRAAFEVSLTTHSSLTFGAARRSDPGSHLGQGALGLTEVALLDPARGIITEGSGQAMRGALVLQTLLGGRSGDPPTTADTLTPVDLTRDEAGELLVASAERIARLHAGQLQDIPGGTAFSAIRRIRMLRNGTLVVLAERRGAGGGPRLWSLASDGTVQPLAGSGHGGCATQITQADGSNRLGLPLWNPDEAFQASAATLQLSDPRGLAVDRDGMIYLADAACHVVYRIVPERDEVLVVAGDGTDRIELAAGPAGGVLRPALGRPQSLAFDANANLLIGTGHGLVRRLGSDNWIETLAGTGQAGALAPGQAADAAPLGPIHDLLVRANGQIILAERARLLGIAPDGRLQPLAGTATSGHSRDGLRAAGAAIAPTRGLAEAAGGWLAFGQSTPDAVRRIASAYAVPEHAGAGDASRQLADAERIRIFDPVGRLTEERDAATGTTLKTLAYDAAGRLTRMTDADARITTYERDSQGRIGAILAPGGQRTTITYDTAGQPSRIIQPDGAQWQLDYDAAGLLTRLRDPNGHATTFAYDRASRIVRDTDAAGGGWQSIEHEHDGATQQVRYTSGAGRVHRYSAHSDPESGVRTAIETSPAGGETRNVSDPLARTTITTAADATRTASTTLPRAVPAGADADRHTTLTLPSGLTHSTHTTHTWGLADPAQPNSHVLTREVTTLNGRDWRTDFDPATATRTTTSPEGRTRTTVLDAQGRTLRTQVPGLAATEYQYQNGLLVKTRQGADEGTGAPARITTYGYDARGHLERITDAAGRITRYSSDPLGRILSATAPDGALSTFAYDAKGNLTAVTPPGRPAHQFGYTPVDQEASYQPPTIAEATGEIARTYNRDRALTRLSHVLGPEIDYAYDSAGRLIRRTTPDGDTTYTYAGPTERIASIASPTGERLEFTYDGPLPTANHWSGTVNGHVASEWNNDLAIAAYRVNDTRRITYGYDGDGLLTQAGDLQLTRHAEHGLLSATSLGALATTQGYNAFGELAHTTAQHRTTPLYQARYTRDHLGRITQKTETIQGQSTTSAYTYDAAGRLIEVTTNGVVTGRWEYDANGNRSASNGQANGTYDEQDRLLQYDVTQRPRPSGAIGYVIDGQDRRIGKTRNGTLVQGFLYKDQLNPIAELDGENRVVAIFVYGEQPNVPAYLIRIDPETQQETTYRILSDHLGSPRLIVDIETGAIAQRLDYDAWGRVTKDTNPGFQPFGFAGGLYDPDTGLVRFGARDYDPYTGRWTAKDPIGFEGGDGNLYGYVLNDPVNSSDSFGLFVYLNDKFDSCVNKCIEKRYGSGYYYAKDVSLFGWQGWIAGEFGDYVADECERQSTRNRYGRHPLNPKHGYKDGIRQGKFLGWYKGIAGVVGVAGAGATGFVIGANLYCITVCASN